MHDSQIQIAIAGAGGRMGQQLIKTILQTNGVSLSVALERKNFKLLGMDVGELAGLGKTGVILQSNITALKDYFDVLIDFTCPKATLEYLSFCCQHNKAMVIGTTGFDEIGKSIIKDASQDIAIFFTANFSVGINIILNLLERTAKLIGKYTDIEIIETHHRYKVDAPSSTALTMGEVIAQAMDKDLKTCAILREDQTGERVPGTIGFSVVRAGDIVGEHTVIFADIGERIEISHKASSRIIFANSAVKSALWLKSKKNGLFNMQDLLNLRNL